MVVSAWHATQTQKQQQPGLVLVKGIWNFGRRFTADPISFAGTQSQPVTSARKERRWRERTWECKSQHWVTFNEKWHAKHTKLSPQQPWKPEVKTSKVHQELGFFHQFHGCSHLAPMQGTAAFLRSNQRTSKNLCKPQTCSFSYYIIQSLLKISILFYYVWLFF